MTGATPSGSAGVGQLIKPAQRDLGQVRLDLERWFTTVDPGGVRRRLSPVTTPASSGVANETLLFDAEWTAGGTTHRQGYVVRVEARLPLYLDSDVGVHYRLSEALAAHGGIPVTPVVAFEADPGWLGAPFFVMARVPGRVPEDQPPYWQQGWLLQLTPAERELVWRHAVEAMVALHRVPVPVVSFLDRPERGASGLEQNVRLWIESSRWAVDGAAHPVLEAAAEWLLANLPANPPTAFSWGDSRLQNLIYDGTDVVAVLDWDQASLAGGEADLAWYCVSEHAMCDTYTPRDLPGIGTRHATVRLWEQLMGRPAADLDYHLVFAAFRLGSVLRRLPTLLAAQGLVPAGSPATRDMADNNPGIQYVTQLLDLPPAAPLTMLWRGLDA